MTLEREAMAAKARKRHQRKHPPEEKALSAAGQMQDAVSAAASAVGQAASTAFQALKEAVSLPSPT